MHNNDKMLGVPEFALYTSREMINGSKATIVKIIDPVSGQIQVKLDSTKEIVDTTYKKFVFHEITTDKINGMIKEILVGGKYKSIVNEPFTVTGFDGYENISIKFDLTNDVMDNVWMSDVEKGLVFSKSYINAGPKFYRTEYNEKIEILKVYDMNKIKIRFVGKFETRMVSYIDIMANTLISKKGSKALKKHRIGRVVYKNNTAIINEGVVYAKIIDYVSEYDMKIKLSNGIVLEHVPFEDFVKFRFINHFIRLDDNNDWRKNLHYRTGMKLPVGVNKRMVEIKAIDYANDTVDIALLDTPEYPVEQHDLNEFFKKFMYETESEMRSVDSNYRGMEVTSVSGDSYICVGYAGNNNLYYTLLSEYERLLTEEYRNQPYEDARVYLSSVNAFTDGFVSLEDSFTMRSSTMVNGLPAKIIPGTYKSTGEWLPDILEEAMNNPSILPLKFDVKFENGDVVKDVTMGQFMEGTVISDTYNFISEIFAN